jgi:hypothetical protein
MSKDHEDVDRARQAQELLSHPLLTQALDAIEREVFDLWANAGALKADEKEALWQHIRACRNFRALLTGYIQTGDLARDNLRRLEEKQTLMQRFRRAA